MRLIDLPPYLPKAFIAIEDRRFYSHYGVDPLGMARALVRDIVGGGAVEGGSTLTQQLAKNLFLTQERTLSRKIQEAILAVWLERRYSKDQILELYLNRVYFGSGAYGVEGGGAEIFRQERPLRQPVGSRPSRRADEIAVEARARPAIPPAPTNARRRSSPPWPSRATSPRRRPRWRSPTRPRSWRDKIGGLDQLRRRLCDGRARRHGRRDRRGHRGHHHDQRRDAGRGGARPRPTNSTAKGAKFGVEQGALVALDPTGGVKALIGGRNYAESQFNRAVAAKRQPGSSFKPFVYLAALEKGLTPDTVRDDAPISVNGWNPENYSREYFGPVTLTKALSLSLNTVAVRLGLEVGPKTVCETAHRLGITSELEPNATIALGTSAVDAARNGLGLRRLRQWRRRRPAACHHEGPHGRRQAALHAAQRQFRPRHRAAIRGDDERDDAGDAADRHRATRRSCRAGRRRARPAPARISATPGSSATPATWSPRVWLGNDDDSPTKKVSGGNLPVEIWSRFMKAAHQGVPVAALPLGTWQAAPSNPFAPLFAPFGGGGAPAAAAGRFPPSGGRGGAQPVATQAPPVAVQAPAVKAPLDLTPAAASAGRSRAPPPAPDAPIPPANVPDAEPGHKANAFLNKIFGKL